MLDSGLNFDWLIPTLAVGGSFGPDRADLLAREHAIRAVVDLRGEACDDIDALRRHGVAHLHLPTEDHGGVALPMLTRGVEFVSAHLDRHERVLVHCEHGIGRAPSLALCVLVARGLAPLDALTLAKDRRAAVSPSAAQYRAWVDWLRDWRARHAVAWEVPSFDAFAQIAYRHLRVT